jgi:hypothetical protein
VHLFCFCTDINAQKCGSAHSQQNNKWFQAMVLGPAASATNGDGDSVKANMLYGAALALSGAGDYLAVGAPGATRSTGSVKGVGLVFLYKRNADDDTLHERGLFFKRLTTAVQSTTADATFLQPTGTGAATAQKFGFSLAFMGTVNQDLRLLVGAPEFGAGTTISPLKEGKVYVYTQDGTSTGGLSDWQASLKTTVAYVNSVNPTSTRKKDALFGASVAGYTDTSPANPDEDASYVFCGAPGDDNDPDQTRGNVYPFKTQIEIGTGLSLKGFAPLGTAALEGEKSDDFGAAVAMVEGNGQVFAAVSAPRSNDDSYTDNGKLFFYKQKTDKTSFELVTEPTSSPGSYKMDGGTRQDSNKLGTSLAMIGGNGAMVGDGLIIAGAPGSIKDGIFAVID